MTDKTQADLRAALLKAAIDCEHHISGDAIKLYFDPELPGHNALNQLGNRLESAVVAATTPPQEVAGLREAFERDVVNKGGEWATNWQVFQAGAEAQARLAAPTGSAAQPAAPVTTGWPAAALMQDECRELSRSLSSKPDAKLHAREAGAAIAKDRALQGMTGEAERLGLYDEPAAAVQATEALIEQLSSALSGMLTFFGMDEDESSKLTFDAARQAHELARITTRPLEPHERAALTHLRATLHGWHERAVALGADGIDDVLHAAEVAKRRGELRAVDGFIAEWKFPSATPQPTGEPQAQPEPVACLYRPNAEDIEPLGLHAPDGYALMPASTHRAVLELVGGFPVYRHPPTQAEAQVDAERVLWFMANGWEVAHHPPCGSLTDEANKEHAWSCRRTEPPYCANRARSTPQWNGPTPMAALLDSLNDLGNLLPANIRDAARAKDKTQ